jgi:AhpD family alkylhydroperoxidase
MSKNQPSKGRCVMTITAREKELSAVSISVSAGCKPCTSFHVKAARKVGASDDEISQSVDIALSVRARATDIMRNHALSRLGVTESVANPDIPNDETSRDGELISIGAAFGVNCVSTLEDHLAAAANVGISQEEIEEIIRLAMMIKRRAASHVERLCPVEAEERAE